VLDGCTSGLPENAMSSIRVGYTLIGEGFWAGFSFSSACWGIKTRQSLSLKVSCNLRVGCLLGEIGGT
jgi:hypothetical protein